MHVSEMSFTLWGWFRGRADHHVFLLCVWTLCACDYWSCHNTHEPFACNSFPFPLLASSTLEIMKSPFAVSSHCFSLAAVPHKCNYFLLRLVGSLCALLKGWVKLWFLPSCDLPQSFLLCCTARTDNAFSTALHADMVLTEIDWLHGASVKKSLQIDFHTPGRVETNNGLLEDWRENAFKKKK